MATITHKLTEGARVQFHRDAFRTLMVREWARDVLQIESVEGRDVRVVNLRTGERARVDSGDLHPYRP